ncbi:hypothetical protein [Halostagnicola sp. A56]|uniref:hypothetical protein n=1 Tax=Halostagnicola sp. A56 TaxID=1495067 RepID=UPI000AD9B370|nr:hypothetical protein [Halostagnicola sp. A56]
MAATLAGSTVAAPDDDRVPKASTTTESSFDDVLAPLPASVAEDSMAVAVTNYERMREADQPYGPTPPINTAEMDADNVSKSAFVTSYTDEYSRPLTVLSGDIELPESTDSSETDAGVEYEYYDAESDAVVASDGDVVVASTDRETVEAAFDANAGKADRLLETESAIESGLSTFPESDARSVQISDEQPTLSEFEDVDIEYTITAQTVIDADTIEMSVGIELADESDATDELIETLESQFAYAATTDEPSAEVDGSFVSTTVTRDLAAERAVREHESPGYLQVERDFDIEDDDRLEIEIGRGDPTPIEDLTLEVDDEPYDRDIWADGHGKLEEGDTIVIEMDDVEPNLSVSLTHEHELGSSSSGTTILSHFRFESSYDVDSGELTLEYADEFPLDGDQVFVAAFEERRFYRSNEEATEPRTSSQPWDGETMAEGDTATIEDVEAGDTVIVGWKGTDYDDSISRQQANPPGRARFEYQYDDETLEATLEFGPLSSDPDSESTDDVERSASEYELQIDGEPADTQWTDEFDTVSTGATIEVDDVAVGSDVEAVWAETDATIGGTHAQPSIDLAYDDGTVEHVGGDALPAADLEAEIWAENGSYTLTLGDEIDGDFEDGDSFTVDAESVTDRSGDDVDEIGTVHHVSVRYDGEYRVGYAFPER